MQILETFFYFIVTLGILVFVHELGHFLAAKLSRMRVERFSIGFPPRAFGKVIGETDYCVSWVPIGGYVKISGMIDESFDVEHLAHEPEPWEFRARPLWQRMFVISAGVLMNILLAICIFWGLAFVNGNVVRKTTTVGYVAHGSPAEQIGFQPSDRILRINDEPVEHWEEVFDALYVESMTTDLSLVLMRGGAEERLFVPRSSIPDPGDTVLGLFPEHMEVVIRQVDPDMPANALGLTPGDVLVFIGETRIINNREVIDLFGRSRSTPVDVTWRRGSELMAGTVTPNGEGKIGISIELLYTGPKNVESYSLLEAFPVGLMDCGRITLLSVQHIWLMITGEESFVQNIGGPVKIAQYATQSSAELGIANFLGFMAVLSISLAILNMLPIPALDGGHFVFLVYEGIFRREIPAKVRMLLQQAGFALLIAFMAFVVLNDIVNF